MGFRRYVLAFIIIALVVVFQNCGKKMKAIDFSSDVSILMMKPPTDKVAFVGDSVQFQSHISLTSDATAEFRWYKGVELIPEQSNEYLSLSNLSMEDSGEYRLEVHLVETGENFLYEFRLDVYPPPNEPYAPLILDQPVSQSRSSGESVFFHIGHRGFPQASIQWYKDGRPIGGATKDYLLIENIEPFDTGMYTAQASNDEGVVESSPAMLVVDQDDPPPQALSIGEELRLGVHQTVHLKPQIVAIEPPVYTWFKDGIEISGSNQNFLFMDQVTVRDSGDYTIQARNSSGFVEITYSIDVVDTLTVTEELVDLNVALGERAVLSSIVEGEIDSIQWFKDDELIAGENALSLEIPETSLDDTAEYKLVVGNVAGTIELRANLVVVPPPVVLPLDDQDKFIGENVVFQAQATGIGLTYEWLKDGVLIDGETTAMLALNNITLADAGDYTVRVTNIAATVEQTASLTVYPPPVILTGLANATVPIGSSHTFSVSASGEGISYEWYKDSVLINGETGPTLTIANVVAASEGTYRVDVSNLSGTVSSSAVLSVIPAPVILTELTDGSISLGEDHTFTVSASGANLSYAWYKDDVVIPGATSLSYTISNAVASDEGTYRVDVSNASGTVSSSAMLTVFPPPVIISDISGANIPIDGSHTFTVSATGNNIGYTWYKDNVAISGANSSSYTVSNATMSSAGTYRVDVSNLSGTVSSSADLTIIPPPVITTEISGANIPLGGSHTFNVVATGQGLTYFWYKDGVMISGANTSSYTVSNATAQSAGLYQVVVANASGVVSSSANITLIAPPAIVSNISGASIALGDSHTFTVAATSDFLTYRWYKDNVAISGAIGTSYTISGATLSDTATYRVDVTNASGTVSSSADLIVIPPPVITSDISGATIALGGNHTFTVSATGDNLTYAWYKNDVLVSGETNSTLVISNAVISSGGTYRVDVSNESGTVSSSADLTIIPPPVITADIVGANIALGGNHTFTVSATGSGLVYAWYKDDVVISGATASSYTVSSAVAGSAGTYRVDVSNASGSVSSTAVLTVIPPPVITAGITGANIAMGASHTFTVTATGESLSYTWYKDNVLINGETTSSFTVNSATAGSAGTYRVDVTNPSGTVSSSADLTVIPLPVIASEIVGASIALGENHTFTVSATGSDLTYAWYKDNVLITGAKSASYTVRNATASDAGTYRVDVTNESGTVSSSADLTIIPPPVISTDIVGATIPIDGNHTFTVSATGDSLVYAWYKDNVLISGATGSSFAVNSAALSDGGTYRVDVSNASGTVSSSADLTIIPPPVITTGIVGANIALGASHTFTVSATGTGLAYAWYKDNVLISGETSSSYTISNAVASDAGIYRVDISNASGSASSSASLTVIPVPVISGDIAGAKLALGGNHTFTVTATGESLSYTWYKDDVVVPGETASSYSISSAVLSDAGTYRVDVANASGSVSSSAVLTVITPPAITTDINGASIALGGSHTFTVTATGDSLVYSWYKDDVLISGATASSYTITNAVAADAGTYRVDISNASGSVSSSADLTVIPAPVITTDIAGATIAIGADHTFTVSATGSGLTYAWYKDNVLISGATTASYTVSSAAVSDAGTYRVDVSNASGTVSSSDQLNIIGLPTITTGIASASIAIGGSHTFTVSATGTSLSYAWYKDDVLISGATNSSYAVSSATASDGGTYRVDVSNASGSVSSSAVLTIIPAPVITSDIMGATIAIGGSHTFTVSATGTSLSYAWYKDDVVQFGQTTNSLTVNNAVAGSAGTYRVDVTNASGTVSSSAELVITPPPVITSDIAGASVALGGSHSFSVSATGDILAYAWYKDDVLITGATGPSYTISGATASSAGTYRVDVSNASGTVSSSADITIIPAPVITTDITGATIAIGGSHTFTVAATGSGLSYAWYKDNVLIPGETGSTFTLSNATASDGGTYRVDVSNASGTVSSSAVINIIGLPTISSGLTPASVAIGGSHTFTVLASGDSITYAWYKDDVLISGATTSTYSVSSAAASDAGTYRVDVTNASGTVSSSSDLTIIPAPVITADITGATIALGGSHSFTVSATGDSLSYAWYKDDVLISGATGSSYTVSSAVASDAGTYRVDVANASGSVSSSAILAITPAPVITTDITGATIAIGGSHTFTVSATGTGLSYSWYKDNVLISGATASSYTVSSAAASDAGTYRVDVTNVSGTVSSSDQLNIIGMPTISSGIVGANIALGGSHTFTVSATGSGLSYEWYKDDVIITGATSSSYSVSSAVATDAGNYRVDVTNASGTVSSSASLTLIAIPVITADITAANIALGGSHTFAVAATGDSLSYEWYKDDVLISGATSASYTVSSAVASDAGTYRVDVSNASGSVSSTADLTIIPAPVITIDILGATIARGDNHTFTVSSTGTDLSYAWYKDNVLISGATASTYTINNAKQSDEATYRVDVSNASGTVSSTADLFVTRAPVINSDIAGATIAIGGSHLFTVSATGTGLSYAWYKDNVLISGATNASYSVTNALASDGGTYRVDVSNASGTVSSSADLIITPAPVITSDIVGATIAIGGSHTFTVSATGDNLTYAWYKDDILQFGQTTNSLNVSNAVASSGGTYRVEVSNASGMVSSSADLIITPAPVITSDISGANIFLGEDHTFTVGVTGDSLSYTWYKDSVVISGATGSSYTVSSAVASDAGVYRVDVTNASGVVSSTATLTIKPAPVITSDITGATIAAGGNHTFTVSATGDSLSYAWYKDSVLISGATSSSYTVSSAAVSDGGLYRVDVTNPSGTVSSSASLMVLTPVSIVAQPASVTVTEGDNVMFSVIASGSNPSYQWRENGVDISGATSNTYSITSAQLAMSGNAYSVVVSNSVSSVTSNDAILTVNAAIDGAALYTTNCSGCHGAIAVSAKRNRTAAQIQAAIDLYDFKEQFRVGEANYLDPAEVQAISDALSD